MHLSPTALALKNLAEGTDRLVATHTLPARAAKTATWPNWLGETTIEMLAAAGINEPWSHQVEAAQAIHAGKHTIITTSTGSGKSLAAWIDFFNRIAAANEHAGVNLSLAQRQIRPTALYLAPTKALAADQSLALQRLGAGAPLRLRVGTADGDTSREAKNWAADAADIIATNPDFLHHVLLANPQYWRRVLRGLALIVFDEVHFYRGVAAANIALVLRRLIRLARHFGGDPRVVFLSATAADPAAVVARYLGCDTDQIAAITADGSPAGERTVLLWQPALAPNSDPAEDFGAPIEECVEAEFDVSPRLSTWTEAGELADLLLSSDQRFLVFARSRYASEAIAEITQTNLRARDASPELIRAYRGGYLPQERRELERELRGGTVRALATTSALEVGIDISGLDATVSAGWPGTRASFWQQCGRAGRAGRAATNVLIASDNPLDHYFLTHPKALFDTVETTVFDVSNPYLLAPHLCSAAAELPLKETDLDLFGPGAAQLLPELVSAGFLRQRPDGYHWNIGREGSAHDMVDLRGDGHEIQIVSSEDGAVIGTVAAAQAQTTVFPGARYVHQGRVYQVSDLGEDVAFVSASQPQLRTRASVDTDIRIIERDEEQAFGAFTLAVGTVEVTKTVRSFDLLRLPGMYFAGEFPLSLPAQSFQTRAVWWTINPTWFEQLALSADLIPGSLHAAEHAAIGILPLLATCDRWDLGGLSTALHGETELPTIFVHDAIAGGSGLADFGYTNAATWWRHTAATISDCGCERGCPRCVVSPKCGNGNRPLYKRGADAIMAALAQQTGYGAELK